MASELLIVVGAGASKEFGLPIGSELKKQIAELLNFRHDRNSFGLIAGDSHLYETIAIESRSEGRDFSNLLQTARHICDAIPQAISIDNFIDTHAGNTDIELVGKLAIVRSILKAEQSSKLYFDQHSGGTKPDFSKLEDVWLTKFFRLLTENCRVDGLPGRMQSVAMIVFNYDRCIENFLFHSLRNYYGIGEDQAASLMAEMKIYHPYGKVGALPWERKDKAVRFGGEPDSQRLLSVAKGIKTFTEGTDPGESEILAIKRQIAESKTTLFLGFAFHRLNLNLLVPKWAVPDYSKKYFATAFGMSKSDVEVIKDEVTNLLGVEKGNFEIRNDLLCHQLFHEFGRSISLI